MTRAAVTYSALVEAIEVEPPPCRGDDRYTAETLPLAEMGEVQLQCSACPVFRLCRDYALAARPPAGIWAGERWTERKRPGRPTRGAQHV